MYSEQYFYTLCAIWFIILLFSCVVLNKKFKPLKAFIASTLISLFLLATCIILFSSYVYSDGTAKGIGTLLYLTYFGILTIVSGSISWLMAVLRLKR